MAVPPAVLAVLPPAARPALEDFVRARALWSRLAQILSGSGTDFYAAGLARFSIGSAAAADISASVSGAGKGGSLKGTPSSSAASLP